MKNNSQKILFLEKQYLRYTHIMLFVIPMMVMGIFSLVKFSDLMSVLMFSPVTVIAPFIVFTGNITTKVQSDGVYYRFFPLHLSYRRIPPESIKNFYIKSFDSIKRLRWEWSRSHKHTFKPKGYTFQEWGKGMMIEVNNGSDILLGTKKPKEFLEALESITQND